MNNAIYSLSLLFRIYFRSNWLSNLFSTPKEDISFKDCDDWPHSLVPDKECLVMYPWNLRVWERLKKGAFPQARASISFNRKVSLPSSELMHDLATVLTDSANRTISLPHSFSFYLCSTPHLPNTHRPGLSLDLSILHQPSPLPFLCIGQIVSEPSKET